MVYHTLCSITLVITAALLIQLFSFLKIYKGLFKRVGIFKFKRAFLPGV